MKDMIANFKESPRKIALFVGVPVALVVVLIVVIMMATGGSDEDEIEFVFDDTVPAEPVVSVEEQVRQTVEASIPTATPEPTADVPATLVFMAEQTREAALADQAPLVVGPTPDPFASTLSPADLHYLDTLGRPIWLATKSHLRLTLLFDTLPDELLLARNNSQVDSIRDDARRAATLIDETTYVRTDVSRPVTQYGRFVEDLVHKIRDAANETDAMFNLIDFQSESYDDLPKPRREDVNAYYYRVGQLLDEYDRDIQRFGCSACGELYRGR